MFGVVVVLVVVCGVFGVLVCMLVVCVVSVGVVCSWCGFVETRDLLLKTLVWFGCGRFAWVRSGRGSVS